MAHGRAALSDFTITGPIGSGTSARVLAAVHTRSGQPVAIKMLEPAENAPTARERFAREAVLLAGVSSPHVNQLLGFGFENGAPFLVLERLHGETLDAKLRRDGAVPLGLALPWVEELLLGLRDCHDAQIIHRDIKPSNVFVHEDAGLQIVKLIDFGVARLRELGDDVESLTPSKHVLGSMAYMAPEQFADARSVTFAADLYAVGVLVFRALTGRLPFVGRTLEALVRMKAEARVPPISSMPGMPRSPVLDAFVARATARDPDDRFASARAMLEHWWNVQASLAEDDAVTDPMRHAAPESVPETRRAPGLHDSPTSRNDPELGKLVEQELQLSKWRRRGPA